MAPHRNNSTSSSNCHGENAGPQTSVLASAYCVDSSARLTGFHYSTTGAGGAHGFPEALRGNQGLPSPPSSPPLAALISANELALQQKPTRNGRKSPSRRDGQGASYIIREECERLFCGTLKAAFFGEEGRAASRVPIAMGTNRTHSPPEDDYSPYFGIVRIQPVDAWIEVWDYAGGCSFRGFVGGEGDKKSLFAFFDASVIDRDLKQGLMALIELAEVVFAVSQVVICLDRLLPESDRKAFMKSLRWVGFELITFDLWTGKLDSTSDKWLFMGMEI